MKMPGRLWLPLFRFSFLFFTPYLFTEQPARIHATRLRTPLRASVSVRHFGTSAHQVFEPNLSAAEGKAHDMMSRAAKFKDAETVQLSAETVTAFKAAIHAYCTANHVPPIVLETGREALALHLFQKGKVAENVQALLSVLETELGQTAQRIAKMLDAVCASGLAQQRETLLKRLTKGKTITGVPAVTSQAASATAFGDDLEDDEKKEEGRAQNLTPPTGPAKAPADKGEVAIDHVLVAVQTELNTTLKEEDQTSWRHSHTMAKEWDFHLWSILTKCCQTDDATRNARNEMVNRGLTGHGCKLYRNLLSVYERDTDRERHKFRKSCTQRLGDTTNLHVCLWSEFQRWQKVVLSDTGRRSQTHICVRFWSTKCLSIYSTSLVLQQRVVHSRRLSKRCWKKTKCFGVRKHARDNQTLLSSQARGKLLHSSATIVERGGTQKTDAGESTENPARPRRAPHANPQSQIILWEIAITVENTGIGRKTAEND